MPKNDNDKVPHRFRSQRVAIFNHKGGVGKTTLTVNIAAALASLDKRVLLVDADPQCNLTSYLFEESVVDDFLDHSDSEQGKTVWTALKPVSEGTGGVVPIEPLELSESNTFLVPGDIRLSEFEEALTSMWAECFERRVRGFRGTSALSYLVNKICAHRRIDYVFYDCGPNIGPLNRAILLDCDWFIVPAACDLFSIRALRTLGRTVASWVMTWSRVVELAPTGVYVLPGFPKFLGYIPQRFRVYRGQVSGGYSTYFARIERRVNSDIVSVLRKVNTELASKSLEENKLGQIKDFGTVANASQVEGVAMARASGGAPYQREEAEAAFTAIAKKIIRRTTSGG